MAAHFRTALAAAAIIAAGPALADKRSDIEAALRRDFGSVDANGDGVLDGSEITRYVELTFAAKDANGDGVVSPEEFRAVTFSLTPLADRYGRRNAFEAARERVRRRWTLGRRSTLSEVNLQVGAKGELLAAAGLEQRLTFARFKRVRFIRDLVGTLR